MLNLLDCVVIGALLYLCLFIVYFVFCINNYFVFVFCGVVCGMLMFVVSVVCCTVVCMHCMVSMLMFVVLCVGLWYAVLCNLCCVWYVY